MAEPRWDTDERGTGIGDAAALAPGAHELLAALSEPGWVAEDPDAHLLPHLRQACERLPLELDHVRSEEAGAYLVSLRLTGARGDVRAAREAAFGLIGAIAESATYVRQRRNGAGDVDRAEPGDDVLFEVATGMLAPDTAFASHGHVLALRIRGVFG